MDKQKDSFKPENDVMMEHAPQQSVPVANRKTKAHQNAS